MSLALEGDQMRMDLTALGLTGIDLNRALFNGSSFNSGMVTCEYWFDTVGNRVINGINLMDSSSDNLLIDSNLLNQFSDSSLENNNLLVINGSLGN